MNLACWLERAAKAHAGRPAIGHGARIMSDYAGFGEAAARVAGGLSRLGLDPGDRVGIASKNCVEYFHLLFGIWWAGCVAVPINAKLHGAEIGWILENSGAGVLFADAACGSALSGHAPDSLERTIEIGAAEYAALVVSDPVPLTPRTPDDLAWLFYTSGTTGRPKGAMLTHRNLVTASFGYLTDVDPCEPGTGCSMPPP
jgi:long-chain acyl-CoA synthetase